MKTPREENFAKFASTDSMNEMNPKKLAFVFNLPAESQREQIQNVLDYAESPEELLQLLAGTVAANFGAINANMLYLAAIMSPAEYDKLELFGEFPNNEEAITIVQKFHQHVTNIEIHSFEEAIEIALANDEFNNWPTIIAICFGLIISAVKDVNNEDT